MPLITPASGPLYKSPLVWSVALIGLGALGLLLMHAAERGREEAARSGIGQMAAAGKKAASIPVATGPAPQSKLYASVSEARKALEKDKSFTQALDNGWTVFTHKDGRTWSFVPSKDPAYPAAIGQIPVPATKGALPQLRMEFMCEGAQKACDALFAEYQAMTMQIYLGKDKKGAGDEVGK